MSKAIQVIRRCRELATITDVPGETTRTFLSPAMSRCNDQVAVWMSEAGLEVTVDTAGNLRGRRRSDNSAAKTFVIASHLDTVPNAGAFDGVLGVLMGVAVAEQLRETSLPFHLEVIGFSEEEGVRFGTPFIGSRALTGTLDDALLDRRDTGGISLRDALQAYQHRHGLTSAALANPYGYFEFHIEQGPELDTEDLPLAVVESIAGQSRYDLMFRGQANHAGTTPMTLRRDAMAAAAEWIVEVERYARATPGLVATNGEVRTLPGMSNVIPGEVRVSLDVRSALDTLRLDATKHLLAFAAQCGQRRGVTVTQSLCMQQGAMPMDFTLMRVLEDAVDSTGTVIRRMVSGAGHDAMIVSPHMPAAMLFLRSPGGISHHPDEKVLPGDVQLGLDAGVAFMLALAAREVNV